MSRNYAHRVWIFTIWSANAIQGFSWFLYILWVPDSISKLFKDKSQLHHKTPIFCSPSSKSETTSIYWYIYKILKPDSAFFARLSLSMLDQLIYTYKSCIKYSQRSLWWIQGSRKKYVRKFLGLRRLPGKARKCRNIRHIPSFRNPARRDASAL